MSSVQIEQKSHEMPPQEGISVAQFLTAEDRFVVASRSLDVGDGAVGEVRRVALLHSRS
jgi:hypothetical protein